METKLLLPDLNTGVIFEVFHSVEKQPDDSEWLNSLQSEDDMLYAVCFNMWEEIPSGPVDVLSLSEQSRLSTSSTVH